MAGREPIVPDARGIAGCVSWRWLDARGSTVLLPLGSVEDRPWGPAALDCILALEASCRAARRCGLLVAPPVCYTLSDPSHEWSASTDPGVLARLLEDVAASLSRLGSRVVIVNAHEGNRWLLGLLRLETVHIWDLLERLGYNGWDRQVAFEKMLARGEADRVLDELGRMLCEEMA